MSENSSPVNFDDEPLTKADLAAIKRLDAMLGNQKTVSLSGLKKLGAEEANFDGLADIVRAVHAAAKEQEAEHAEIRRKINEGYESALRGEVRDGEAIFADLERKIKEFEDSPESSG